MLCQNLASMGVEESIRVKPAGGVALLAGCDKTTPAVLVGNAANDMRQKWREVTPAYWDHCRVLFLASDNARMCSAQEFTVDGGWA